jgi:hypothetical protein
LLGCGLWCNRTSGIQLRGENSIFFRFRWSVLRREKRRRLSIFWILSFDDRFLIGAGFAFRKRLFPLRYLSFMKANLLVSSLLGITCRVS